MRRFAILVLAFFFSVAALAAQDAESDSLARAGVESEAAAVAIPRPTMGWVLGRGASSIPAAFGGAAFEAAGPGVAADIAMDGAGNIDGAALSGGNPTGTSLSNYLLKSASEGTLQAGTTVMLLCGRENNFLRNSAGVLLPVEAPTKTFLVTKPGEWGLSLVGVVSPFAVASGGQWIYASVPPIPASFTKFGTEREFPAQDANAQVCVWAFYDTSVKGSKSAPEISVAYDDGAAGAPVKLKQARVKGTSPLEIVFNQLGADLGTLFVWQGSAATPLFQQAVRAAYWNGGLRRTIISGFQTPPWSKMVVTKLDPRPMALGGDAIDNTRAQAYPAFVRTSPFAHYSVTTSPNTPFLAVQYALGNFAYHPAEYSLTITLDGEYMGYEQPWTYGVNLRSIPLPMDGKSHTLDLRNGFARGNGEYRAPTSTLGGGGFITAVGVSNGHTVTVNHPVMKTAALVLSHSVAIGESADTAPWRAQGPLSSVAWPMQARAVKAFGTQSVVDESYGGELLANECLTVTACNAYIAAIRLAQPNVTVGFVARMLNDFFHGPPSFGECLPEYEQSLENLFNAWHASYPGVPLHVGSDIRESAALEATTDGCTPELKLEDWRAGIEETVKSYSATNDAKWLHFVDMSEWVPQNELLSGGIHPNTAGQVKMCQAVANYFHQPVHCNVPQ